MASVPEKVHFVGSIALDSVEDVFSEVGRACGRRLRRIPDGEPGGRRLWISWQWPVLRANPWLRELDPQPAGRVGPPIMEVAPGTDAEEIRFGELGYAREARASYADFLAARERGVLPPGVKFQVSLPTPFAVVSPFLTPESSQLAMPAYERAMFDEVRRIADAIPREDLAIQWDVCIEMIEVLGALLGEQRGVTGLVDAMHLVQQHGGPLQAADVVCPRGGLDVGVGHEL